MIQKVLFASALFALATVSTVEKRVDIDVVETPPKEVFELLADALGVELNVPPRATDRLTMRLESVSPLTALQAACESLGCTHKIEDGALHIEYPPEQIMSMEEFLDEPMSVSLKDARLGVVLDSFKRIRGVEVRVAEHLGDVLFTLEVRDESVREVLDKICQEAGCTWSADPAQRLILVEPR